MKPIVYCGEEMPIGHLAPMRIACPCAPMNRELLIDVGFANHCYTEKFIKGIHSPDQIVVTEARDRHRVFCPVRYKLSFRLPKLIEALPRSKVHQTSQRRNYVYVVRLELEKRPYEIYFMLQRAANNAEADLRLMVESAYLAEAGSNVSRRPNSIRFMILAYKILANQPVRFAPR
ncbi:hypothetical protein [Rhodopseudomonas sp. BR0M22]|uniref:hypothetical protein n=1 Tax=Rhodopseudomonas sp. BR0M22 TaxID=2269369 RepID=UPI0013DFA7E1|nr:hypothetical protein [Rhodopseudomonas sp. BR0M22]NEW92304.1 hypothetical protein [Rhodopseudomonas sp. BR0M22]